MNGPAGFMDIKYIEQDSKVYHCEQIRISECFHTLRISKCLFVRVPLNYLYYVTAAIVILYLRCSSFTAL